MGLQWTRYTHFGDGLAMQFGDLTGDGNRWVGQWALHISTAWRFESCDGNLLTGRDDFFFPRATANAENRTLQDEAFESLFHQCGKGWNAKIPLPVSDVVISPLGDVDLHFGSQGCLRIFVTTNTEAWRIFRPGNLDSHFVFGGEP